MRVQVCALSALCAFCVEAAPYAPYVWKLRLKRLMRHKGRFRGRSCRCLRDDTMEEALRGAKIRQPAGPDTI
jgi:hypothetical protein